VSPRIVTGMWAQPCRQKDHCVPVGGESMMMRRCVEHTDLLPSKQGGERQEDRAGWSGRVIARRPAHNVRGWARQKPCPMPNLAATPVEAGVRP
jgi:hypothetical protein